MLFLPLLVAGIITYFSDKRIWSAIIFFFFITSGFQLIPLTWFDTGSVIKRSEDFALLYTVIIFFICIFKYPDFLAKDKLNKPIFLFLVFVFVQILLNKYSYFIGWAEIFRTSRFFFFVLAYYIFKRLSIIEIKNTVNILFLITLVLCSLYILQSIIGYPILTGATKKGTFGTINRYYNTPLLYHFFFFYSLFYNPLKGKAKYISMGIFILGFIVSLHRSIIFTNIILCFVGIYISQGGIKGVFKYIAIGSIILIPFMNIILSRFEKSTRSDIDNVMMGAFTEYGSDLSMMDGTFLFRLALFYERFEYVKTNPVYIASGVGFMTEDSPRTKQQFDFKIGLHDKNYEVVQLDTSDISWANFLLRLGLIGTLLFLYIYFVLAKDFYKNRKENYTLVPFLYILFLLITSFACSLLYDTLMLLPIFLIYIVSNKQKEIEEKEEEIIEYP